MRWTIWRDPCADALWFWLNMSYWDVETLQCSKNQNDSFHFSTQFYSKDIIKAQNKLDR